MYCEIVCAFYIFYYIYNDINKKNVNLLYSSMNMPFYGEA